MILISQISQATYGKELALIENSSFINILLKKKFYIRTNFYEQIQRFGKDWYA